MTSSPANSENFYHYNRYFKYRARRLRSNMTKGERVLWKMLRRRSIHGYCFTRQRPVLNYIADFMCKELLLIIESDGITHESEEAKARDRKRDAKLKSAGFTTMRFKDWEIIGAPNEVYMKIKKWVEEKTGILGEGSSCTGYQPPNPLQRGN